MLRNADGVGGGGCQIFRGKRYDGGGSSFQENSVT